MIVRLRLEQEDSARHVGALMGGGQEGDDPAPDEPLDLIAQTVLHHSAPPAHADPALRFDGKAAERTYANVSECGEASARRSREELKSTGLATLEWLSRSSGVTF